MKKPQSRSGCPIATTLDCVGDSWSMVIVRDMLLGKKRYGELLASPEGIPTNILANRLSRMQELGLVEKRPYQTQPLRHEYSLTAAGRDLVAVRAIPIPSRQAATWRERWMRPPLCASEPTSP